MLEMLLNKVLSLPRKIADTFLCWPLRNGQDSDSRSVSSESSTSLEKTVSESNLQPANGKTESLPCYFRWPDNHFAVSEYESDENHFVNLTRFATQDRLVARALSVFTNRVSNYADPEIPYEQSMDLDVAMRLLSQLADTEPQFKWTKREYYVVAYYSTLRVDLTAKDRETLADLDEAAFREALPSQALVKYWFGRPDGTGRNLATCLWTNRNIARRTLANGPYHRRAAREGQGLYQKGTIDIREYALTIDEDVKDWSIELLSRRIHT